MTTVLVKKSGLVRRADGPANVCMCCTDDYLEHVAETAWSISRNDGSDVLLHVFTESRRASEYEEWLNGVQIPNVRFKVYDVGEELQQYVVGPLGGKKMTYSAMSFARLLIFGILKDVADRVVYFDTDIIVRRPCLDFFRSVDMCGQCAVAAQDINLYMVKDAQELSITGAKFYFNAGMMVFDIGKCVQAGVPERIESVLSNKGIPLKYADQTVLNIVLSKNVIYVNPIYNTFVMTLGFKSNVEIIKSLYGNEYDAYLNAVSVLHFAGGAWPCKGYGANATLAKLKAGAWAREKFIIDWAENRISLDAHVMSDAGRRDAMAKILAPRG